MDTSEILQENHYYPFGMLMKGTWGQSGGNKYQYNGRELNEYFELEWLDYGARWYDPSVGRFPSVDPIIEQFPWVTPYNYAENEPVGSIDLWGLQKVKSNNLAQTFIKETAQNLGRSKQEAQYAADHPMTAVGAFRISVKASSFANSLNTRRGITNAVRHTFGQALASKSFGVSTAAELGDAHEADLAEILETRKAIDDNGNDLNILAEIFLSENGQVNVKEKDADSFVDQLNNFVGRTIANDNPEASKSELKSLTLKALQDGFLFEATKNTNTPEKFLTVQRIELTQEERDQINE